MAEINPNELAPELEDLSDLAKELPPDVNMDDLIQNITRIAMEFMKERRKDSMPTQLWLLFGLLIIPISLILFCFCKILINHRKRQGKDKKKQKEQKKENKTEPKKESKTESKKATKKKA